MVLRRTPLRAHFPLVPTIVAVDGNAMFFAVKSLGEGRSVAYPKVTELICGAVPGLAPPTDNSPDAPSQWVMWTSWSPDNAGQNRFLEFVERELRWVVRRLSPSDSFVVDPSASLGVASDSKATGRLMRFDAAIAFAMGRVAAERRIVIVSDSYPLAEPLERARRLRSNHDVGNWLAFFGRALDPRWQRVLRMRERHGIDFFDLDDHEDVLFGGSGKEVQRYQDDLSF